MTDTKIKHLNQPGDYYFCSLCGKWHTDARKDHLQYSMHIQRDPNIKTASMVQPPRTPSSSNSHHSPTAVIGSFDGAESLWKNENELLNNIPSIAARCSCESVLTLVKSLDKNLHIQHFNRKNGFSFIVKGLKIAEIKLASGGFVLTLIQNIFNHGYTSVHQEKKDFVYAGNPPISDISRT